MCTTAGRAGSFKTVLGGMTIPTSHIFRVVEKRQPLRLEDTAPLRHGILGGSHCGDGLPVVAVDHVVKMPRTILLRLNLNRSIPRPYARIVQIEVFCAIRQVRCDQQRITAFGSSNDALPDDLVEGGVVPDPVL